MLRSMGLAGEREEEEICSSWIGMNLIGDKTIIQTSEYRCLDCERFTTWSSTSDY